MNGRYLVDEKDIGQFMKNYVKQMEDKGLSKEDVDRTIGKFYSNRIVKKYSRDDMDSMWEGIMKIVNSPGGVGWLIQNMDYMPEFEHPRFKGLKSFSKTKGL